MQRAVPKHQLEVKRRHEEPGEHRRRPEDADQVGNPDVAQLEETERNERRGHARLDPQEERQQRRGSGKQAQRLRRRPARLVSVHDRVNGEHQRGRHGDRAGDVEPSGQRRHSLAGQQPKREHDDEDSDREIDQEDPVPIDQVGQDTPE